MASPRPHSSQKTALVTGVGIGGIGGPRTPCGCGEADDVGLSGVDEPWITRYDAAMNPNAKLHYDTRSNVTLNIMLSDPSDYTGGGTFFHASGRSVRLRQGQALIHPGRLVHRSVPVTSGTPSQ